MPAHTLSPRSRRGRARARRAEPGEQRRDPRPSERARRAICERDAGCAAQRHAARPVEHRGERRPARDRCAATRGRAPAAASARRARTRLLPDPVDGRAVVQPERATGRSRRGRASRARRRGARAAAASSRPRGSRGQPPASSVREREAHDAERREPHEQRAERLGDARARGTTSAAAAGRRRRRVRTSRSTSRCDDRHARAGPTR